MQPFCALMAIKLFPPTVKAINFQGWLTDTDRYTLSLLCPHYLYLNPVQDHLPPCYAIHEPQGIANPAFAL